MACYHPLKGFRSKLGKNENGSWSIAFDTKNGLEDMPVTVPCGQCIGCRLERSRQWAVRIMHESKKSTESYFLTLTYNDENLGNNELNKQDIILFIKSYRQNLVEKSKKLNLKQSTKFRYYQCGEYGEKRGRRHHHMAIWKTEVDFSNFSRAGARGRAIAPPLIQDKVISPYYQPNIHKYALYTSQELEALWGKGSITIADLTFESAAYIARYIAKNHKETFKKEEPQYATMSRKPGIGYNHWEKYKNNIRAIDGVITRGMVTKTPRYYDKLFEKHDPEELKTRKEKRILKINPSEQTYERLEAKRLNAHYNMKTKLKRKLD
nr:MAG: replication initiator protein [Microviridae sp.]